MYRNPPPPPVSHLSVSQPKSHRQLSPIGGDRRAKENYYHDLETESMRDSNQGRKSRQSRRSRLSRYEGFSGTSSVHSVTAQIMTSLATALIYILVYFLSLEKLQDVIRQQSLESRVKSGQYHVVQSQWTDSFEKKYERNI